MCGEQNFNEGLGLIRVVDKVYMDSGHLKGLYIYGKANIYYY